MPQWGSNSNSYGSICCCCCSGGSRRLHKAFWCCLGHRRSSRLLYLGPRSAWHRKCNFNEAFKWQLLYLPPATAPATVAVDDASDLGTHTHSHTHMEGKVLCSCCCCCWGNVRHALGMTPKVLAKWATWKCYWPKWLKEIAQNFSQWLIIKTE